MLVVMSGCPMETSRIASVYQIVSGTYTIYINQFKRDENLKTVIEGATNDMLMNVKEDLGPDARPDVIINAQYTTGSYQDDRGNPVCFCTVVGTPVRLKE